MQIFVKKTEHLVEKPAQPDGAKLVVVAPKLYVFHPFEHIRIDQEFLYVQPTATKKEHTLQLSLHCRATDEGLASFPALAVNLRVEAVNNKSIGTRYRQSLVPLKNRSTRYTINLYDVRVDDIIGAAAGRIAITAYFSKVGLSVIQLSTPFVTLLSEKSRYLLRLLHQEYDYDYVLTTSTGDELKCHKFVLASRTDFFSLLLSNCTNNTFASHEANGIVLPEGISKFDAEMFLHILYTDGVPSYDDDLDISFQHALNVYNLTCIYLAKPSVRMNATQLLHRALSKKISCPRERLNKIVAACDAAMMHSNEKDGLVSLLLSLACCIADCGGAGENQIECCKFDEPDRLCQYCAGGTYCDPITFFQKRYGMTAELLT